MSDDAVFFQKVPPAVQKYLQADAPRDARLMVAKGTLPMVPAILITAVSHLLDDADAEVQQAARKTLLDIPEAVATGVLKDPSSPKALDFFGRERSQQERILEIVLLNPLTPDGTFVVLAEKVGEKFTTIIANNQVRLLRTPAIAEALRKNPHALRSTIDTMVSFLRINGVILEGESAELSREEILKIISQPELTDIDGLPQILTKEIKPDEAVPEKVKMTIQQLIATLNVAKKVKLALMGNKEARGILIKDSNKIVATAVVKNNAITDGEILAIAAMRQINDDVIRTLANNPEWTRNYPVQVALANNPKTPFPVALKFVRQLHVGDLRKLVGNKNISSQLAKLAKELFEKKRGT